MAVNQTRRLNADLVEGMSDSCYRKVVTDRGGVVERTTWLARRDLVDGYYSIHETPEKALPDGTVHATSNYVPTPPAQQVYMP